MMTTFTRGAMQPLGEGGEIGRRGVMAWVLNAGWVPLLAAALLTLEGVLAIDTTVPSLARRQAIFGVFGVLCAAAMMLPGSRTLTRVAWPLYLISIVLLIFVLIPGVPEWLVRPKNGARRWISLGLFEFQPSEIAKIAVVLALAQWLRSRSLRRFGAFLMPFLLAAPPMLLILIEPDLGTALMFAPAVIAMAIAAGARLLHIGLLVGVVALGAPLSYPFLKPHQRDRVDALMAQIRGDDSFVGDIGFQGDRAMTLAGSGGLFGVGRERAQALVHFNRLPEEHNDMIFAVICCRWGFFGGVVTWGLGLLYAFGALLVASGAREPFSRFAATGIAGTFIAQLVLNTGMTVGVMPVTGVTLPFISYGGSSLVALWIGTGLLCNFAMRRARGVERLGAVA
jgi:cell division protein FtsW (lipid II flippase)